MSTPRNKLFIRRFTWTIEKNTRGEGFIPSLVKDYRIEKKNHILHAQVPRKRFRVLLNVHQFAYQFFALYKIPPPQ
jgi:hypothetical protein